MVALLGALRADLRRAFLSPLFVMAIASVVIVNYLSIFQEYWFVRGEGLVYYLEMFALIGRFSLVPLCLVVLPYGLSFCQDWKNQFIRSAAVRSTKPAYGWSKVMAVAMSGFACVFLGFVVTAVTMVFYMPLVGPNFAESGYGIYSPTAIGSLMMVHPLLFLLARFCMFSLACMFWAVFALAVSSYCANIFVVLASPVLTWYAVRITIGRWLPSILSFDNVTSGLFSMGGPVLSLIWVLFFYAALSAACGLVFVRRVRRRLANG
jgi:hypothetical protein